MNIPIDWNIVAPAVIVLAGALIGLLVDAFYPRRTWNGPAIPACVALVGAGAAALHYRDDLGRFSFALVAIVIVGTLFVVVASIVMNFEAAMPPGEYHFLVLSAAAGALMMVVARDLVTLVISLELVSLPSIALVGLRQGDHRAIRSAWTFFLASVVSTAITLMGISLLYGVTGSMDYAEIRDALAQPDVPQSVVAVAVLLTLIGLLFKLGAVPFHVWIPDAYTGASVMVAGFLSTVSKAASLGALLILVAVAFPFAFDTWQPLFAVVAAATMTIGNLGALRQADAIGMLAWSSVAQAGFLLAPATALLTIEGLTAPVQYLAVYAVANLVAFAALSVMLPAARQHPVRRAEGHGPQRPVDGHPAGLRGADLGRIPTRRDRSGHQVRRDPSGHRLGLHVARRRHGRQHHAGTRLLREVPHRPVRPA
ncbi:NADH-quinone oxidoreductase subunit N [Aeromicrobium sp. UC242_57]|uniref:NADH-quinone oxidoreductase subunit N n=1 Tax=Aeromicrobium sp. UC242_57 TaxID=3374624 RepID=UPI003799A1B7